MKLAINFERVDPNRGGAETYVVDLCRRLTAAGHDLTLYAREWRTEALPEEVRKIRVAAAPWPRALRTWSFARHSQQMIKSHNYDCVIGLINTWHQDVLIPQGGLIEASIECGSRRMGRGLLRSLYVLGKKLNLKHWVCRAIERKQYDPKRRTRVVAVSGMVRGHLEKYAEVPRERICVIHNAIDAKRLEVVDPLQRGAAFRSANGVAQEAIVGLFLAHNFALKGLGSLIEAMAFRTRHNPQARPLLIVVCGCGKLEPYRRMAQKLGVLESFRFVGFVADVRSAYAASNFFVLPTYYDPCALVVFEALACGLPVITTSMNGAGEVITNHREGIVITTPESHGQLADALDCMADDHLRAEMAGHARELAAQQTIEQHVSLLLDLCAQVAAEKAALREVPPRFKAEAESPARSFAIGQMS